MCLRSPKISSSFGSAFSLHFSIRATVLGVVWAFAALPVEGIVRGISVLHFIGF